MADPLLRPTVTAPSGEQPWQLMSIGLVAFLGGAVAGTAISLINAGRLGVGRTGKAAIAAIGAATLVVTAIGWAFFHDPGAGSGVVLFRLPAVLAYLVQAKIQHAADLGYQLRRGDYAPLWGPGAVAVIGSLVAESALVGLLTEVFS